MKHFFKLVLSFSILLALASCVAKELPPASDGEFSVVPGEVKPRVDLQVIPLPNKTTAILYSDKIFQQNTSKLANSAKTSLNKVLQLVNNYPQVQRINVFAFTDNQSANSKKQTLLKANAIAAYLWKHGIPHEIILAKGFGASYPVSNNNYPTGRADNRRVEVTLMPKEEPPLG